MKPLMSKLGHKFSAVVGTSSRVVAIGCWWLVRESLQVLSVHGLMVLSSDGDSYKASEIWCDNGEVRCQEWHKLVPVETVFRRPM